MALTKVTGHVVKPDTNIQFHNTKSTGIVTFAHTDNATSSTTGALQVTGGVGIVKDLHVGGNITVGGTLTYDDVTNIDSIGIITARDGIFLPDNKQVKLGNTAASPDFKIYHNTVANTTSPPNYLYANSNYIDSVASQNLFIRTSTAGIYLGRTDGFHAASFHTNGSAVLYHNASGGDGEKFRTVAHGINVTGGASVSGVSTFAAQIYQTASGSSTAKLTLNNASDTTGMDVGYSESSGVGFINVGQSGSGLSIKTGGLAAGNERIRITSAGNVGIASNAPAERLVVQGDGFSNLAYDKDGGGFDGTSGGSLVLTGVFDYSGSKLGLMVDNAGQGRIMTKTGQALYLGTNNTRRISINNIGYVGINTTNAAKLFTIRHVDGRHHQFSYDDNIITMKGANNNNNPETMRFIADTLRFDTGTSGSGTEALRISNSGKILTGGETSGEISDGGIHIKTVNNGGNTHALILENHGSSADTQVIMKFAPTTSTTNDRWNSINVINVDGNNKFDTAFYTCPGGTPLEAMRIDNQQRLLIGWYQAVAKHQTNPNFQISGTSVDHASASLSIWGASADPARLEFSKSRHGTIGSHTAVAADDTLGEINFSGSDGTRYLGSAYIKATATTPIADYDCAGFLSFGTNYGTTSPAERVRITKEGYVHIGTASNLGTMRVGGQAITGQDQDPIIKVYTSSSNQWLAQLRSDHTTGNGVFLRAGNSSSTYTLYATGYDENNAHLVVRGDGKIGIGEKTPIAPLTLNKGDLGANTTYANAELIRIEGYGTTNSKSGIGFGRYNGGQNGYVPAAFIGARTGTWSGYTNCHLTFATRNTTGDDNPTERLRIQNDGRIKFMEDPVQRNSGAVDSFAGDGAYMQHYVSRNGSTYRRVLDIAAVGDTSWGCAIRFSTNPDSNNTSQERLRITHDGKTVAGGTGNGYSERLQAHGGGSTGGECLSLNSTGGNNIATELRFYENGTGRFRMKTQQGNPGILFEDWTNAATRAEISGDGDFKIHSGTRSWATIMYRHNSRGLRRHYREFGTGASASTFNLIRVRRHYWGWGHYKFTIKRGYYSGIAEDVYYLNGHGRDDGSYNPSYSIGQRQYNGHGSNFGYSGRITITSPSGSSPGDAYANFVDVRLECPAYMYFVVEVEAFTSGYSLDTSSISSDAYALHN